MIRILITKTREISEEEKSKILIHVAEEQNNNGRRFSGDYGYNEKIKPVIFPTEVISQILDTEITEEQFKAVQKALVESI